MLGPFGEERGTPTFTGSGHLGPFLGDPQFLFSSATMPESWVFFLGGGQPVFMRSGCPGLLGRERWVPAFPRPTLSVPSRQEGRDAQPVSNPSQVPILVRGCWAGPRRGGREAGASTGHCKLAGRAPGSSPGPGSPPPAPRAPPDLGGRAGAVATNERARRLWEPGRLCPPGIGHAVGSGGRGLGGPRAWLGQACCWVTGRRVSPGNGGGYRSLAGREGGGGRGRRQAPQTPATARGPRPGGER